jgi:hypothetical protein
MTESRTRRRVIPLLIAALLGAGGGCDGDQGDRGLSGPRGPTGPKGDAAPGSTAKNLPELVKERVARYAAGDLPEGDQFPLAAAATDGVRTLDRLRASVVVRWLDPLTWSAAPDAPRFGANADYVAYFGDGWDAEPGAPPQWGGDGAAGWVWVNHESVSGGSPRPGSAPTGQHLALARRLQELGVLTNDVTSSAWSQADLDTYIRWHKRELGGSWLRVVQDPSSREWAVDRSAAAIRYDATSGTLLRVTGQGLSGPDHDDATGAPLPDGVVSGIMSDCAGGVTPWGTVITAEENVQDYYGDMEGCWTYDQRFLTGKGFDPGADVAFVTAPSLVSEFGRISDPNGRHARDYYGYLTEMDPGKDASEHEGRTEPGVGHRKIGALGRARWEAATFAVDRAWKLAPDQPIVVYGSEDRPGGRIFKLVTSGEATAGMGRAELRALLDEGTLYVAHFAGLDNATGRTLLATGEPPTEGAPGEGRWVELSLESAAIAPNAEALGDPARTVGEALADAGWNGIGRFATDDDVRRALFTASAKIGAMELNRPEDIEWDPRDPSGSPRLYVAFTYHVWRTQLDQDGVLRDPATQPASAPRGDGLGEVFALEEADPSDPGASMTFKFFEVWHGTQGHGDLDAANPDNLVIDPEGGVWFATDGNFGVNGRSEGVYYLDLDPAHRAGQPGIQAPTFGLAFRAVAMPSDAEATGIAFSADAGTLFVSAQHPGAGAYSEWPDGEPLSSLVAVSFLPE